MWYSDTGLGTPQDPEQAQRVRPPKTHLSDCDGLVKTDPNERTGMPRIKGTKRTLEVKIRLTETEWNELQQRKTKSLAGWLRDLGLGAVPIRQADPDLIRHLARIGSNLNQIARHANTEKQLDVQVLQELAKANALLDQLVTQAEKD